MNAEEFDFREWRKGLPKILAEHPYVEKILYLNENLHFANRPYKIGISRPWLHFSNCLGTALFVAGVDKGHKGKRPRYVHDDEFESATESWETVSRPIPGDLAVLRNIKGEIEHSAVYLGELEDTRAFFHQEYRGGHFITSPVLFDLAELFPGEDTSAKYIRKP